MKTISLQPKYVSVKKFDFKRTEEEVANHESHSFVSSGHVVKPPWERDGYRIIDRYDCSSNVFDDINDKWNRKRKLNLTKEINIAKVVADFYLLDAIIAGVPQNTKPLSKIDASIISELIKNGIRPKHKNNKNIFGLQAYLLQRNLIKTHSRLFSTYLEYAISGEMAHHPFIMCYWGTSSGIAELASRLSWLRVTERFGLMRPLNWAYELFNNGNNKGSSWQNTYGGERWADIVNIMIYYHTGKCGGQVFGGKEFLDRIFNAQHNSGSILTKISWRGLCDVQGMLDAHNTSRWDDLKFLSSPQIRELWQDSADGNVKNHEYNWKPVYKIKGQI